ncbi:MAG: nucleotidyl transferase AbiEii/AbiGii toxin family protein [Gammaproteobacteria bacterium]|nr:nucleotidyl transferase AbiEii/AbiGii toxin family protein [Gammaproteobacteria bacterium]
MAEPFLSLSARERADILRTVAARSGRAAVILEKDIWVCWVLQALFSAPDPHPMAFKGGTSLSKVFGVIDRFSEDVDITLDYRAFNDGFDPFANDASRNQIRRFTERLRGRVAGYVHDVVAPVLDAAAERLAADGRHEIHVDDTGETIRFAYPTALEEPYSYVRSEVLLEFGGRNVIDPNEEHVVVPDMAALARELDYPVAEVTVLSPARTFWEKATLIHVECHRRRLASHPDRLSRHWFDLACLAVHDVGRAALSDRRLLEDVVRHKKVFFHAGYANYDRCLDGRLRLVPDDDELPSLRSDYDAMRAAAIVAEDAPAFDTLMEEIGDLEANVNVLAHPGRAKNGQSLETT